MTSIDTNVRPCPVYACSSMRRADDPACKKHMDADAHLCLDVRFRPKTDSGLAPTKCTCGWVGYARDWQPHRRAMGKKTVSLSAWPTPTGAAE